MEGDSVSGEWRESHMREYKYQELSRSDIAVCTDLWVTRMADGYQKNVTLTNAADGVSGYVGQVVELSSEVVGFGVGHIGTFAEVLSVPYITVQSDCTLRPLEIVGFLDVVCVESEHESNGLGTALVDSLTADLTGDFAGITTVDTPVIVSEVWHRNSVDGGDVLESLGFERVVSDPEYWTHSTGNADPCPECGRSPCVCSGSLYVRR